MNRRAGFKTIKPQVARGQHFRHHDDLTGVHREVFGHVKDCFDDVDVPLDENYKGELSGPVTVQYVETYHDGNQKIAETQAVLR